MTISHCNHRFSARDERGSAPSFWRAKRTPRDIFDQKKGLALVLALMLSPAPVMAEDGGLLGLLQEFATPDADADPAVLDAFELNQVTLDLAAGEAEVVFMRKNGHDVSLREFPFLSACQFSVDQGLHRAGKLAEAATLRVVAARKSRSSSFTRGATFNVIGGSCSHNLLGSDT